MKETTFEELIKETPLHDVLGIPGMNSVKNLMRKVREATIVECEKYLDDNVKISNDYIMGKEIKINLPTDRIKTEK